MTVARDEILRRIRSALRDVPAGERPEDVPLRRDYQMSGTAARAELIGRFVDRLVDYKAQVRQVGAGELPAAIAAACAARGVRRLVVAPDLPAAWAPDGVELLRDSGLTNQQL